MLPFFFGEGDRRLYGCFHAAPPDRERDAVAVLVPSLGQESIRCHRTLRLLADRLAGCGIGCLRFDLFGSGHSIGEDFESDFTTSLASIGRAVAEAQERALSDRVALVGTRLGGSLAALYGAEVQATAWQVLWAPVVDGAAYLQELASDHVELTRRCAVVKPSPHPSELLGFSFSRALMDQVRELDLSRIAEAPSRHVLLADDLRDAASDPLNERLIELGVELERRSVSGQAVWKRQGVKVLVDADFVDLVGAWLGSVTA